VGRPGLEPGTNPESFRGCSKRQTSELRLPVADSSFALKSIRVYALRSLMAVALPRQVPPASRTDALCDCCHAYALRSGVEGYPSHRCNGDEHRARCRPKPYKLSGSAGTRTRNQRLKRALLYQLSYRPVEIQFVIAKRFFNPEPTPKAFGAALPIELPTPRSITF
jgi:hypothetical protein